MDFCYPIIYNLYTRLHVSPDSKEEARIPMNQQQNYKNHLRDPKGVWEICSGFCFGEKVQHAINPHDSVQPN